MKKEKITYFVIYLMMFVFAFGMAIYSAQSFKAPSPVELSEQNLVCIDSGWTDSDGRLADVSKLNKLDYVRPGIENKFYFSLPYNLAEGMTICFRTKNIIFSVFIDDQCIYNSFVSDGTLGSKAVGTSWHYIDLNSSYSGKKMEFRIKTIYDSAKAKIDTVYMGTGKDFLIHTLYNKMFAIVTCLLLLFVGIFLIIVDFPVNVTREKNHELLYLGLFSMAIALWCLMSTYAIQIFTGDAKTVHMFACCLLMLIPIPAVMYLYEAYGGRIKYVVRVIFPLSVLEFIINIALQISGKADLQLTLKYTHFILVISAIALFPTVFYNTIKANRKGTGIIFKVLRGLGLGSIAIAAFIDIIRFYTGYTDDPAKYVRVGLLLFIICYGSACLESTIDTIRLGARAELVSQLAYSDGLTNLGNRTAFKEMLAELDNKKKDEPIEVGIIMFDVNNLKIVNDTLGHQTGDEMLMASANLIKSSFYEEGRCFRIGGDEFIVILQHGNVERRCEEGISRLNTEINEYNQNKENAYTISIASGYSVYTSEFGDIPLNDIYKQADANMYTNKKKMKEAAKMA